MTRGLKVMILGEVVVVDIGVTLLDPMTRGLKEDGEPLGAMFVEAVTLLDPMTRGLKGL